MKRFNFSKKRLARLCTAMFLILLFGLSLFLFSPTGFLVNVDRASYGVNEPSRSITLENAMKNLELKLTQESDGLANQTQEFQKFWEPNIAQAAVHAVAVSGDKYILAAAGGYLKDNEIHVYAYDYTYSSVVHVVDLGDGIINSDVQSLAIDDLDNNGYYEIIAGSSDGYIYVFEQTSTYITLTSLPFVHTWTSSEDYVRVWSVATDDLDDDGNKEIIAGCWDGKVHVFEYVTRGGFPWTTGHWQQYEEVWNSTNLIQDKIYSLATGDTDNDGFREMIIGDKSGNVYVFENGNKEQDQPYPYHYDDTYTLEWNTSLPFAGPIESLKVYNLDFDSNDEIAAASYGRNVYFIDYSSTLGYTYSKVFKPLETWESGGFWPLDPYVDKLVTNLSIHIDSDSSVFPYNSRLAGKPDSSYAFFNATTEQNATAVVDFGKDQEITGDGNNTVDLYFWAYVFRMDGSPAPVNASDYELHVSNNLTEFVKLNATINPIKTLEQTYSFGGHSYTYHYYRVEVELDSALLEVNMPYFRYLKLVVVEGIQGQYIDAIRGTLNLPITEVTSMTVGNIDFSSSADDSFKDKLILGTSDGRLLVYQYSHVTDSEIGYDGYKLQRQWDSFEEDRFSTGDAIWSLELLNETGLLPTWHMDYFFTYAPYGFDYGDFIGNESFDIIYSDLGSEGVDATIYGNIKYKPNLGTNRKPSFGAEQRLPGITEAFGPFYHRDLMPTFVDIDGDDDLDIVVGYANTYYQNDPGLLLLRNDGGTFTYVADVFSSVNGHLQSFNATPYVAFYDMDKDGDYDLTVGHKNLMYFENIGTASSPSWVYREDFYESLNEQRGNLETFRRAAFSDFDEDGDIDVTVSLYYNFVSSIVNYSYTTLAYFKNDGTLHEPIWVRDRTLYETDFQFYENVLLKDIDGDNNLDLLAKYTFKDAYENLIVSFRSFLSHNAIFAATYPRVMIIEVDKSSGSYGYEANVAWDNTPSISDWTFSVEIADTDGDGKREVIIGSFDNNIYTFENLFNGTYRRAWRSPDLKNLESVWFFYYYVWDDVKDLVIGDLDNDGLEEIVAVAGEIIYVFENVGDDNYTLAWSYELPADGSSIAVSNDLDGDGRLEIIVTLKDALYRRLYVFEMQGDNDYSLVWYYDFPATADGSYTRYTLPVTVVTADLDNDGKDEIIVGGVNETQYSNGDKKGTNDGFLWIFESTDDNNYTSVWHAPQENFDENQVNYLLVGDNNENGKLELAVACEKGVVIYENNGNDNQYDVVDVITSSATYPELTYNQVDWTYSTTIGNPEIVQLSNGSFVAVYVRNNMLYSAFSSNGSVWTLNGRVTTDVGQTYENEPSLVATTNNNSTFLVFKSDRSSSKLYVTSSSDGGASWNTPDALPVYSSNVQSPSMLISPLPIVTYIVPNVGIYMTVWFFTWGTPQLIDIPVNSTHLEAVTHELIALSDGTYALVMDGWNKNTTKTDRDIWLFLSQNLENWSQPIRVTSSYLNETIPAIAELDKGVLMITYLESGYIKMKVSTNGGLKWSSEQTLKYAGFTLLPPGHMTLIGLKNGGYMYSYVSYTLELIGFTVYLVYRMRTVMNTQPNWWLYSVNNVKAIAYGDLDNDNVNEIIIGAGNILSIFEYNQTIDFYNLTWSSEPLDAEITDIAIDDTNENGLDELIVTAKGGYVYGFELADKDPPRVEFSNLPKDKVIKVGDLTVTVYAEDQGRITSVEVKIDEDAWILADKINENEFTATITVDSPGIHTIKARATDHKGFQSQVISAEIVAFRPEKSKPVETENYTDKSKSSDFYYSLLQTFSVISLLSFTIFFKKYKKKK